jgi:hypothetical protein
VGLVLFTSVHRGVHVHQCSPWGVDGVHVVHQCSPWGVDRVHVVHQCSPWGVGGVHVVHQCSPWGVGGVHVVHLFIFVCLCSVSRVYGWFMF